jgi:hypothetical protein
VELNHGHAAGRIGAEADLNLFLVLVRSFFDRLGVVHPQVLDDEGGPALLLPDQPARKPIWIFTFSAPRKSFQRISPLLVTVDSMLTRST